MKSREQKKLNMQADVAMGVLILKCEEGHIVAGMDLEVAEDGIVINKDVLKKFKYQEYNPERIQKQMMAHGFVKPYPEIQMS